MAVPSMEPWWAWRMGSALPGSLVRPFSGPAAGWHCFFNEPVMLAGFVLWAAFLKERPASARPCLQQLADTSARFPPLLLLAMARLGRCGGRVARR